MGTEETAPATALHPIVKLQDLMHHPDLRRVLLEQAHRGVRAQVALRVALAISVVITVLALPPATHRGACLAIAASYLVWSLLTAALSRSVADWPVRWSWLLLLVDSGALAALTVLAGLDTASWTADVLRYGFFLVPVLAATTLRPWVPVAVCVPTAAVYLVVAAVGRAANDDEPWWSIILRTAVLLVVSAGAVLLTMIQRRRVLTVGQLVSDRSDLLRQLVATEDRERRELSEHLHDGALQYILAARMDVEYLEHTIDSQTFDRLDRALTISAQLLRATVSELNPSVLAASGLAQALRELAAEAGRRGSFDVDVVTDSWPPGRTSADSLLYATARELLSNVVKHARATRVSVRVGMAGDLATLVVADDGRGIPEGRVNEALAGGHIGLSLRRTRLEADGGSLDLSAGGSGGTTVVATVRVRRLD